MKKIINLFLILYPVWIIGSSVIGYLYPPSFSWFTGQYMTIALAIVMLGMGLTLDVDDFKGILKIPGTVALGAAAQYTVMPLVGWSIAQFLNLDAAVAVGLILVACCPGGTASNVISYLAKANVALSVIMTTVSTFLAIIVTPLLTEAYAGTYVPVDGWGIFLTTVQVVLIPVVLGVYINSKYPKAVKKTGETGPVIAVIAIIFIAGGIVAQSANTIAEYALQLFIATSLLHTFGFILGYFSSRQFRYSKHNSKTVSIEVGMQNGGLAAVLAKQNFSNPLIAVPAVFSSVMQTLISGLLAGYWRWRATSNTSSKKQGDNLRKLDDIEIEYSPSLEQNND